MLKLIIYAFLRNIHSSRRIEDLCRNDIRAIWLSGMNTPFLFFVKMTMRLIMDTKKPLRLYNLSGLNICSSRLSAEAARFELAVQLPVRQFSKLVVSATHPHFLFDWVTKSGANIQSFFNLSKKSR